jgi:hypothetical protein
MYTLNIYRSYSAIGFKHADGPLLDARYPLDDAVES